MSKINIKKSAILGLASLGLVVASSSAFGQELVNVGTSEVFVPVGFDDNDETIIVLDGYLPSSCYKLEKPVTAIDPATKKVAVQQTARRWPGPCLLTLVPYTSVVSLGMMPMGEYTVVANDGTLTEKLTVTEATSAGPDEFLYAPVEAAHVQVPASSAGTYHATLTGRFTNSCMHMDHVKVINSGKTIEVLPVMRMDEGVQCAQVEVPFSQRVELPQRMEEGRHLVHVRSLNGKSVNAVFTVSDR